MGGYYSSVTIEEPPTKINYNELITEALTHGWVLEKNASGATVLVAPDHFECKSWGAIWSLISYMGLEVYVPHYLTIVGVARTGTRQ